MRAPSEGLVIAMPLAPRGASVWVGLVGLTAATVAASEPSDVVLIVIDTARADRWSSYGHASPTTPCFDSFARSSVVFDRAYSTSCWTVPAHASLFTGLYPATHGASQETEYLGDEFVTLAEILSSRGTETACFSGNPWISPRANLAQGFETARVIWDERNAPAGSGLPHPVNRDVEKWLDARDASRPFFLFVNFIEPHWKYQAPESWQRRFVPGGEPVPQGDAALFPMPRWYLRPDEVDSGLLPVRTAMYDAELAYADAVLGELLDTLAARGILDGALVVVTSDHGEHHGDNGHVSHSFALYEGTVRVPLAIRPPGGAPGGPIRTDPVQLVDLFPTILHFAGAEVPGEIAPAWDLLAGPAPADRPLVTEYYYPKQVLGFLGEGAGSSERLRPFLRTIRSIRVGDGKLIWGSDGLHELYDLREDPSESDNRISRDPARASDLERELDAIVTRYARDVRAAPDSAEVDPEILEQLRALGYVK